jgi:DNA repair exonuclease SbcCD ATPase subunit
MNEAAALQARLVGALVVDRGLVTEEQLERALEIQAATEELLGEILVNEFGVSRVELASILAEQWAELERETARQSPVAASEEAAEEDETPQRRRIGEIFVERGFVTQTELEHALDVQRGSGRPLGEVLIELGSLSRMDLASSLAEQWSGLEKLRKPAPRPVEGWQQVAPVEHAAAAAQGGHREAAGDGVQALREELAAVTTRLETIAGASEQEASELRASLEALREQIGELEAHPARPSGELVARVDELEAATRAIAESAAGAPWSEEVHALGGALEELRVGAAETPAQLAEITSRVAAVESAVADRTAVDELAGRLAAVEADRSSVDARAEVAALRADLEGLRAESVALDAVDALAAAVEQVRTSIPDPSERLGGIEERLAVVEQAARRVEDAAPALQELSERIDAVRASVPEVAPQLAPLEQRISGLEEAAAEASWRHEADTLREEIGHLRASIPDRQALLHDVQGMLESVRHEVPDWGQRLDELASELEALRSIPDGTGERIETVEHRIGALEEARTSSPWRQEIAALSGELARLSHEVERAPHGVDVAAVQSATDELRTALDRGHRRLDELAGRVHELGVRIATVEATGASTVDVHTVEQLRADMGALAGSVDESRHEAGEALRAAHELAATEQAARAALEGQVRELVDGVAAGAARSHVVDELATRLGGEIATLADRLGRMEHGAHLAARAQANDVEAAVAAVRAELTADRARIEDRLAVVEPLAAQVQELYARIDAAEEQTATLWSARPPDHGDALHALEARLALTERALVAGPDATLEARLVAIEERLAAEVAQAEERSKATGRALRKGLASVAAELSEREGAYAAAGNELRRSIERLGRAVVDADVRIAVREDEATLAAVHRAALSHVAFVPTEDGYRLLPMDGPPPPLGTLVPMDGRELLVTRIGVSPLPLDERPCVYLARA